MKALVDCGAHTADRRVSLLRRSGPFNGILALEANPAYAPHFPLVASGRVD